MSNWLYKSNTSLLAAKILIRDFANQSVHCSYYSCVQFIYHILSTQLNEEESNLNNATTKRTYQNSLPKKRNGTLPPLGTHAWLHGEIYRSLKSKNSIEADEINSIMVSLYKARVQADYMSILVPVTEAKNIHTKAKKIIEKLRINY